ncbi:unnamed protein product [Nyctereutes procyonoides]|uniref:(raccoon dog) hypothetical protein n=1 Tax=Nyctereutes procyonoides TaxID=34880 RepID=A0A812A122_NYCPR|nr:unnamed protein product [Nyctereutes procyonoides]
MLRKYIHSAVSSCYGGNVHPKQQDGIQLFTRGPHSASQHQAAIALKCVCEHLWFTSIYFVHLLARCVLSLWREEGVEGWGNWVMFCTGRFSWSLIFCYLFCGAKLLEPPGLPEEEFLKGRVRGYQWKRYPSYCLSLTFLPEFSILPQNLFFSLSTQIYSTPTGHTYLWGPLWQSWTEVIILQEILKLRG